jgi:hypothetical protein
MGNFMIRLTGNSEEQNGEEARSEPIQTATVTSRETEDTSVSSGNKSEPRLLVHVIDWEFATYALPYIDLAHFAPEAWLFDFFRRESDEAGTIARTMTATLFDSYSQAGGAIDFQKVIVYIAGHIGCFLHYTDHWNNDETLKTAACIQAVAMIENAGAERWDELSKDIFLKSLLPRELTA